ncbi:MAG TPA: NlpC/P60 family protein [Pyrinomonadaceae bacterium]|nr:NlpC/P60 family protein [Pyrinomonadaceae bacterium]
MTFTPAVITGPDVVRQARAYMNVPFRHQGETRTGLDCSGLCMRVAKDLAQMPADFRRPAYSVIRPNPRLFNLIGQFVDQVERAEASPGDLFTMYHSGDRKKRVAHMGFLSDLGLIHIFPAMSIARVTEHSLDDDWASRILGVWRFRGVLWV